MKKYESDHQIVPNLGETNTIPLFPGQSKAIEKPDENQDLNEKFDLLIKKLDEFLGSHKECVLYIPKGKQTMAIPEREVACLRAKGSYTEITLANGESYIDSKGFYQFEGELNPSIFFKTNRSWMVNLTMVDKIVPSEGELLTNNGISIPISRNHIPEVKKRIQRAFSMR